VSLTPIGDLEAFAVTRDALHAVAEHVLAAYRYRVERRIGLVVTDRGFGTPDLPDGGSARVARRELVVVQRGVAHTSQLTTLAAAGAACGIEPGAPDVYPASTPLVLDAPLPIDIDASDRLDAWNVFAWAILAELGGDAADPTLWPEHFDAAVELGDEAQGTRGTFGASPGDDEHATPYLYVTHWSDALGDPYWNDAAFGGSSLTYEALVDTSDPAAAAHDFFATGRALLGAD
jgi:hypothetical protein